MFLWITFGTVFAGAVHDYFAGMLSERNNGASISEVTGIYLGSSMKTLMRVFSVILLVMVGTVFAVGPAGLIVKLFGNSGVTMPMLLSKPFWLALILLYYFIATFISVDKVIGRIYPVFGVCLIIMAVGVCFGTLASGKQIPEVFSNESIRKLEEDREYLEHDITFSEELTKAAKQKRIADKLPKSFRVIGFAQLAIGIAALLLGLLSLANKNAYAIYFIIGGGALLFISISSGALPGKRYSKAEAQKDWDKALDEMREHLKGKPDFFLPVQYAHPVVINRIIRIIREGCSSDADEAFEIMKKELKALDNTVMVSQSEYDEVVKIKPIFLVCDYKDEI